MTARRTDADPATDREADRVLWEIDDLPQPPGGYRITHCAGRYQAISNSTSTPWVGPVRTNEPHALGDAIDHAQRDCGFPPQAVSVRPREGVVEFRVEWPGQPTTVIDWSPALALEVAAGIVDAARRAIRGDR